nr:hypothetical protein [Tanacetum cinerariifolium]
MKSSSSQANQPYSSVNHINLDMDFEQLMFSQEYYPSQDYSMGHGSAYGSAPVNDDEEDESHVEEVSPVKPKKPSRRAVMAKKNDPNEPPKEWTVGEEIAGEKTPRLLKPPRGQHLVVLIWTMKRMRLTKDQEVRPPGHDQSKAKKKSAASSRGKSSSYVDLLADKFLNIKKTNGTRGRRKTVLYPVEESGVGYPGGRASESCRVEKKENCNSTSNPWISQKRETGQRHIIL